jgi:hypothetical protein
MLDWQSRVRPWPSDPAKATAERRRKIAAAREIWAETVLAAGTLLEVYLWSRLLMITPPASLRLHRSLWHRETSERRPAMVARVDHQEHGFVAVHCTYLAIDGSQKATIAPVRKSFGPIGGSAVRLGQIRPDQWLIIGTGIETTLAVMISTGLPGWAALSDGGLTGLVLPPEAERVLIAADHDEDGGGEDAALVATARFLAEGRHVKVIKPPTPGTDFNDLLLRGSNA